MPFDPSTPFSAMRAVYCRLSDDDPDTVSIEHQIEACREYAQRRGLTIVAIYIDWRTGVDPDRLGMRQLIEDAHARKHPGVIFYDDTRFHRDISGAYPVVKLHAQLREYTFESARGVYDIEYVGMLATASGRERENTRRRSMEQRRTRAQHGEWMNGMKPYWLDRDSQRRAVIARDRAEAFLSALLIYTAPTGSAREAAQWMTEHAPLDPRRNASQQWTTQRFRLLLRNPALWGELPYARGKDVPKPVEGQWAMSVCKRIDNPDKVPFAVPPLIHKDELERTQCRLSGGCERDQYPTGATISDLITQRDGKTGGRPYNIEHPLHHARVLCPCGWRVRWQRVHRGTTDYLYITCAARMARGRTLANGSVCDLDYLPINTAQRRPQGGGVPSREGVWPRVRRALVEALQNPQALAEEQRRRVLAEQEIETRSVADEARLLAELDGELAVLDERENRLYERWDSKEIGKNVYDVQTARIGNERRAVAERKRHLLEQQMVVERAERAAQKLTSAFERLHDMPPSEIPDGRWGQLLPNLVEAIVLDVEGNPTIRWLSPA